MFEELLDAECTCGRPHSLQTRIFEVSEHAVERLPDVLAKLEAAHNPLAVYDDNTYRAAFGRVNEVFPGIDSLVLSGFPVKPDEFQLEAVKQAVPGHSILLAVGSGVINDLVRYAAFQMDLPFVSVPTAASVDGYVSNSSAMTLHGNKMTLPARAPDAVVADLEIIAAAPMYLTASGVGDMLSKYISVADWEVGALSADEYYCRYIADLERQAADLVVKEADGIARRDLSAMKNLVKGLLLSGLAMQMAGITRPASSFEHHFSHYLETVPVGGEIDVDALHGEKVGVATRYAAKYYPVFARSLALIFKDKLPNRFSLEKIKALYSDYPPSVVEWVEKENVPTATLALKVDLLEKNFDRIMEAAGSIPPEDVIRETLEKVGGRTDYRELHMTRDEFRRTMEICCYIRNRYTLLRLVCDYALFDFDTMDD